MNPTLTARPASVRRTCALLVLAAAVAAGCSSSDDDDPEGMPSSPATQAGDAPSGPVTVEGGTGSTGSGESVDSTVGAGESAQPAGQGSGESGGTEASTSEGAAPTDPATGGDGGATAAPTLEQQFARFEQEIRSRTDRTLLAFNEAYSSGTLAPEIVACIPEDSTDYPSLQYGPGCPITDPDAGRPLLTPVTGQPIGSFTYNNQTAAQPCRDSIVESQSLEGCEFEGASFIDVGGVFASFSPATFDSFKTVTLSDKAEAFYASTSGPFPGSNCDVVVASDGTIADGRETVQPISAELRAECDVLMGRFLSNLPG